MSHQWQTDFPVTEALAIGNAIRGGPRLDPDTIRQGWVVVEYGIGQLLPSDQEARSVEARHAVAPNVSPEVAIDHLVVHAEAHRQDAAQRGMLPPLDWLKIVHHLAPLLINAIAVEIGGAGWGPQQ